jgi:type IV pilus assembly protein PilV
MANKRINDSGFTLVEILVAITIFAVGLLAIAGLQANAIQHNSGSTLRTTGTALAQGVMEQVLSLESDNPLLRVTGTNIATIDPEDGDGIIAPDDRDGDDNPTTLTLLGGGSYTANWTVTVDTPVARVSRIVVSVQEASGRITTLTGFKRYTL